MIKFLSLVPVLSYIFKEEIEIKFKEYINILILLVFIYIANDNHKESIYLLLSLIIFNLKTINTYERDNTITPDNHVIDEKHTEDENTVVNVEHEQQELSPPELKGVDIVTRNDEKNQDPILYGFNFNSSALL